MSAVVRAPKHLFFSIGIAIVVLASFGACVLSCTEDLNAGAEAQDAAGADADAGAAIDATDAVASDASGTLDAASGSDGSMASTDGATQADADAGLPLEDGGCGVVIAQEGALVPIQVFMDGLPTPGGGNLVAGTYVLTAFKVHGGGPQGTGNVRETIVLSGNVTAGAYKRLSELTDATGAFTAHGPLGETFTTQGSMGTPAFFQSQTCPPNPPDMTIEFTAAGTSLTFVDEATAIERVYEKIH